MRQRFIFILVCTFVIINALAAQDSTQDIWNFAITLDSSNSSTGLIAYNGEGESNLLLQGTVSNDSGGWKIDSQTALAILSVDGSEELYKLTPDAAEPLHFTGDTPIPSDGRILVDYSPPFLILMNSRIDLTQQVLLVNLETGTFEPLPHLISGTARFNCCRFSEDGTHLRYTSAEGEDGQSWALRELDLATGEETVFAALDNTGIAAPTAYGESWLARFFDRDAETITFKLIHADGSSNTLLEEPRDVETAYQLFGDYLVSISLRCEGLCDLKIESADERDAAQIYHIQVDEPRVIQWMYMTPDGSPVILANEMFFLLEDRDTVVPIGYFNYRYLLQSPTELASPDGRWLLTLDGDGETVAEYGIWDSQTKTYPLTVETPENRAFVNVFYGEDKLILRDLSSRDSKTRLFRYENRVTIELPNTDAGIYGGFLTPDSLIYVQRSASEDRTAGIYRYDVTTEVFTLLVENAQPLLFREVSSFIAAR